ncbi:MAG: orotate phosphoribosyltransferase [Candidatus Roizmanbacteria bacterium]|nr:orotate phosphoribosyltransferase [Candidatus Roizmanbacteria bacterium]
MKQNIAIEVADILLKIGAVTFRFDPPYTYTSGIKSPIYLDNRIIISHPDERKKIIDLYIELIKNNIGLENIDYVSATATAAIPQGAWIADRLSIPMVYCRSDKKGHGKENQIEGSLKTNSNVVIVEDHISTAGSSIGNAEAVRKLGGKVFYIVASTTYETKKSSDQLKDAKLKLFTLTNGKIIVEQAVKKGLLNKKQKELVDDWFADPVGWAKKHGFE